MKIFTKPTFTRLCYLFSVPIFLRKRSTWNNLFLSTISLLIASNSLYSQTLPANFSTQVISSGWNQPVGLTFSPDGNVMFVWEKSGKVYTVVNGVKSSTPLVDISPEVGNWRDHGLVGFTVDPKFSATGGYIYLLYAVDRHHLLHAGKATYSATTNEYFNATIGRLTRYRVSGSGSSWSSNSRKVLLGESKNTGFPILHESHGAGSLVFGSDGTLLVSIGDGASYNGVDVGAGTVGVDGYNANDSIAYGKTYAVQALKDGIITAEANVGSFKPQLLTSLSGKVLRLDPATGNGVPSNPYYEATNPRSARSRIWAMGFRNPYRMSRRPDTGSSNASDGNPGVFYLGDVGWGTWEEMDVINAPGQNFGWPLYEGLEPNSAYPYKSTRNPTAPNPLANGGNCPPSFRFRDLLKQPLQSGRPLFPNPCNTAQQIPAPYQFVHTRPIMDWKHGTGPSRVGTFTGNQASVANVGASGSPVSGSQFGGNAATGGVWYTGDDFPPQYKNTYFAADYGTGWMKNLQLDGLDNLQKVGNFINSGLSVVCMATHPTTGSLYYIQYGGDPFVQEVRRIYYSGNYPPQAVAQADKLYGPSPFTVNFTGSNSRDPEGGALTYRWNFGDGSPVSTLANPSHTFTAPAGVAKRFEVTLTVTDNQGATSEAKLVISVNNTPPVVKITSPVNNSKYSIDQPTTYNLTASVSDGEHTASGLTYQWQTILHHNNHSHADPYDTNPITTTEISPVGCDGETYYFQIVLTVTDAAGLSASDEVRLYPNCGATPTNCTASGTILREVWNEVTGTGVATIPVNTAPSSSNQLTLFEAPSDAGDNYGQRLRGYVCAPVSGNYTFWIASDNDGELWLSTDDSPANKRRIAYIQANFAFVRQWDKLTTQKSALVNLVAGQRYYIEALHKEGFGGDNLAVGWQLPNGTQERPIPGSRLSPFVSTTNQAPTVSLTAPTNNATFTVGSNITVSANAADANGSVSKVEFFRGTTSLGIDNTAPYSVVWSNATAGTHTLKAVATDNQGASTTSALVNVTVSSTTPTPTNCTASGTILREVWNNVTGTGVSAIPANTAPSSSNQLTLFEAPSDAGDNYGQRLRGYICVPNTGNYTFWIASDNDGELWLSTNDSPANKRRIAYIQANFAFVRQWDKLTTQKSTAIYLQAGKRYYIEALHKEAFGGDNLAVGWQLPNGTQERPIPGSRLSPFVPGSAKIATDAKSRLLDRPLSSLTAHPNPFSRKVNISFVSDETGPASLDLYDLWGKQINQLYAGEAKEGEPVNVEMDGQNLPEGMFIVQLKMGAKTLHHKIILSR